ncbi:MAG: sodium:calcium antiporter [Candidatus Aenigmarchaeota archaeon]|nr:sodium:calcium antiporter [Candidatus Aenigmarchaeota archaeon]
MGFVIAIIMFAAVAASFTGMSLHDPPTRALFFGLSVLCAAFMLSWAAELAQLDIPKGLAIAILALIAVMPEYAVDAYFAWTAGTNPSYIAYATANMTGANRLLIGAGWALLVFIFWLKTRKHSLEFDHSNRVAIGFLLTASLYSLIIPIKGTLSLMDTLILILLFVMYMARVSKTHMEEPHLVGPPKLVASFTQNKRRTVTILFFLLAAAVIFISTEPFAESLLETGAHAGIDEFLLVQWLAPLASEAPEFIIAFIFAFRLLPKMGFEALLSSKINQWTLLIGALPLIYALSVLSSGAISGAEFTGTTMILDHRQVQELLLTAAQSLFAVSILLNLRITFKGAIVLFALFVIQFAHPELHYPLSFVYLILALFFFIRDRKHLKPAFRSMVK